MFLADLDAVPLEMAIHWSLHLVESMAQEHDEGLVFGQLSPRDVVIEPQGPAKIVTQPKEGHDVSGDILGLGNVLARLFMSASATTPRVEHAVEQLLGLMLESEPARRPSSLEVVEALLGDLQEDFFNDA